MHTLVSGSGLSTPVVSILKEVFVGQAKDLILPSIPVDFGVLLLVMLINYSKFLIQNN